MYFSISLPKPEDIIGSGTSHHTLRLLIYQIYGFGITVAKEVNTDKFCLLAEILYTDSEHARVRFLVTTPSNVENQTLYFPLNTFDFSFRSDLNTCLIIDDRTIAMEMAAIYLRCAVELEIVTINVRTKSSIAKGN